MKSSPSERLPSAGTCILEVSTKERFGVSNEQRNTQHLIFVGDLAVPSAVAARRKGSTEAGGDHLESGLGRRVCSSALI